MPRPHCPSRERGGRRFHRHRHGRTLPSRLAAIARGTGEVDCVYHIAFEELVAATDAAGTAEQKKVLDELIT
jgi:hypothetical protein